MAPGQSYPTTIILPFCSEVQEFKNTQRKSNSAGASPMDTTTKGLKTRKENQKNPEKEKKEA